MKSKESPRKGRAPLLAMVGAILALMLVGEPIGASAQEGVFLSEEDAPRAVFPDADAFARQVVPATADLRDHMRGILGAATPSLWEEQYVTFVATRSDQILGRAIIVEEIGKHRPITFIVGLRTDGSVSDVAVMAYREAYGGEVKSKRFLKQYRDKTQASALQTHGDIQNIAGATLSVDAASRAVKKAMAVTQVAFPVSGAAAGGGQP